MHIAQLHMLPFDLYVLERKVYLFAILFDLIISDLVAELPFILMHPKPEEEENNIIHLERSPGKHATNERGDTDDTNENASGQITTGNLIQLDG